MGLDTTEIHQTNIEVLFGCLVPSSEEIDPGIAECEEPLSASSGNEMAIGRFLSV
ncbi:hypothetical protein J6590_065925 [Homalodisca vitripennis]|nr:hypothetical protein J6590_065925 [Homalodisca vitripennis]